MLKKKNPYTINYIYIFYTLYPKGVQNFATVFWYQTLADFPLFISKHLNVN